MARKKFDSNPIPHMGRILMKKSLELIFGKKLCPNQLKRRKNNLKFNSTIELQFVDNQ